MAAPGALNPGDTFAGKYTIIRMIGAGGMGLVYEARHRRLNTRVALKVLHRRCLLMPDIVARFEQEARAAVQLRCRHVARVFDVDTLDDGSPFMVMEYLEGRDLLDEMAERKTLPVPEAVDYVLQACAAMAEAHRLGIVHRDLTPGNLFITEQGEERIIKVLDFGISKYAADRESGITTPTQATLGTPLYMSPEQVRSAKHVDGRSDMWSLGIILYEMLAGCLPFPTGSPSAVIAAIAADKPQSLAVVRPDLPAELTAAVMKALEKNPDARYPNVEAFAEALTPFGSGNRVVLEVRSDPPRRMSAPRRDRDARALDETLAIGAAGDGTAPAASAGTQEPQAPANAFSTDHPTGQRAGIASRVSRPQLLIALFGATVTVGAWLVWSVATGRASDDPPAIAAPAPSEAPPLAASAAAEPPVVQPAAAPDVDAAPSAEKPPAPKPAKPPEATTSSPRPLPTNAAPVASARRAPSTSATAPAGALPSASASGRVFRTEF